MTSKEARSAVYNEVRAMQSSPSGCAKSEMYQKGKISGMVAAFRLTGVLSDEEANVLMFQILTDLF